MPSLHLTLSAALVLLPLIGFAQVSERMIEKTSSRNEPVKLLKIKTKNKEIELGKNFAMDDDWLLGLTVTVQNVSDKPIARIDLRLDFPRPGGGTSPETAIYMAHMTYGREPADVLPNEVVKLVLPSETVEVKLPEANVPYYKEDLEKLGYKQPVKHVYLMVYSVTFVDGSEWAGNVILYPNPNNPKQKINPRLPTDIQTPKEPKSPASQSTDSYPSRSFRFLHAGVNRAHAQPRWSIDNGLLGNFWLPQLPENLPCDSIFERNDALACGPDARIKDLSLLETQAQTA